MPIAAASPPLSDQCAFAATFWGRMFSGLGAMTYRERGLEALEQLWLSTLSRHQEQHYRDGLKKLAIPDSDAPAIAAAKYHYLTNLIGGLDMEYVEESPRKVWIRYKAPMWTYPGVSMLAIPGSLRRTIFRGWHPKNGIMMGCRRLGYVATKFIMEGDPYDEGYFVEYDRDLSADEIMRYEVVDRTPEFDPSRAPRLDPILWPSERIAKARRNFARGYAQSTVASLYELFGEAVTHFIVGQTMRCLAIQFIHDVRREAGVDGTEAHSIAQIFSRLASACGETHELERQSGDKTVLKLSSLNPFPLTAHEGLKNALFEFQVTGARLLNGHLKATRRAGPDLIEYWEFEDTGRWRW